MGIYFIRFFPEHLLASSMRPRHQGYKDNYNTEVSRELGEVVGHLGTPRRVPNSANGHKKLPTAVSLRMGRQAPLRGKGSQTGGWGKGGAMGEGRRTVTC